MQEQDIQAWEREINHAAKMQEQRKEKPKNLRDILVEHGIGAFKEENNEK